MQSTVEVLKVVVGAGQSRHIIAVVQMLPEPAQEAHQVDHGRLQPKRDAPLLDGSADLVEDFFHLLPGARPGRRLLLWLQEPGDAQEVALSGSQVCYPSTGLLPSPP